MNLSYNNYVFLCIHMLTKYKFNSYYYKIDFRRQTISLMEVVTKCNCLLKYLRVFEGGYFIYGIGQKHTHLSKSFYEDGPLKRYAYENRGYFQRRISKEACLRKHAWVQDACYLCLCICSELGFGAPRSLLHTRLSLISRRRHDAPSQRRPTKLV